LRLWAAVGQELGEHDAIRRTPAAGASSCRRQLPNVLGVGLVGDSSTVGLIGAGWEGLVHSVEFSA